MELFEKVKFVERKSEAFERMYQKEIERELNLDKRGVIFGELTRYDWASELENHFYPMKFTKGTEIGLILPFRRLIFYSMPQVLITPCTEEEFLHAIGAFSKRRGYQIEYHEYAWQHEPIIEGLKDGTLPKRVSEE